MAYLDEPARRRAGLKSLGANLKSNSSGAEARSIAKHLCRSSEPQVLSHWSLARDETP